MTNLLNPKIGVLYLSLMPGLYLGKEVTAWLGAPLGGTYAFLGRAFLRGVAMLSGFPGRYLTGPKAQAVVELV